MRNARAGQQQGDALDRRREGRCPTRIAVERPLGQVARACGVPNLVDRGEGEQHKERLCDGVVLVDDAERLVREELGRVGLVSRGRVTRTDRLVDTVGADEKVVEVGAAVGRRDAARAELARARVLQADVRAVARVVVCLHEEANRCIEAAARWCRRRVVETAVPLTDKVRRVAGPPKLVGDRAHRAGDAVADRIVLVDVDREPAGEQRLSGGCAVGVRVVAADCQPRRDEEPLDVRQEHAVRRRPQGR
eukprot:7390926-Prymnesium_polylepis.1